MNIPPEVFKAVRYRIEEIALMIKNLNQSEYPTKSPVLLPRLKEVRKEKIERLQNEKNILEEFLTKTEKWKKNTKSI